MSRLADINRKYEEVMSSDLPDQEKNIKLAELMTDMEREFRVPALRDPALEKENRAIIALYRKISLSRKF